MSRRTYCLDPLRHCSRRFVDHGAACTAELKIVRENLFKKVFLSLKFSSADSVLVGQVIRFSPMATT